MEERTLLSTWMVTNTNESGKGSLRYEVGQAAAGDSVDFANDLLGKTITLTSGPITLGVNVTIEGQSANNPTVSGGRTQQVFVVSSGVTATIESLTIADGLAAQGGGIDNFGDLTVTGCTISGNLAVGGAGDSTTPDAANGGGIANEVSASLTLTDTLLSGNVAAASPGDDAFGGALLNLGSATISYCTFTGNQATGGASASYFDASSGGAIESFGFPPDQLYGSTLQVTGCTFSANQAVAAATGASEGGAIDLQFGVIATITSSYFTANVVTGGSPASPFADGGAAINTEGCTLTLSSSAFSGNHAVGGSGVDADAGAVSIDTSGTTVNVLASSFTGNLAEGGTGASAWGGALVDYGGAMNVSDSTLSGNEAVGGAGTGAANPFAGIAFGGAAMNFGGGSLTLTNCALTGNQVIGGSGNPGTSGLQSGFAFGGGIENEATLMLVKSTLVANVARGGVATSGTSGDGLGGGLDESFSATATVTNSVITGNLAQGGAGTAETNGGDGIGGGIAVATASFLGITDNSSLAMSGSTVRLNVAAGGSGADGGNGSGGGVFVGAGGSAVIQQTLITLNGVLGGLAGAGGSDGDGIGGGLYVASGGAVTLKHANVTGNFASTSNNDIYGIVTII
jgi:hypothetical protein